MSPVPADHSTTATQVGTAGVVKLMLNAGWNYRRTIGYYLKHGQFKRLGNFLYTKTLVPTGEGSGELAYYFIGGLLQKRPMLAPYPKYVEIEITSICNKRCIICEHTHWNEPGVHLSLAEFLRLTDQFDLRWTNLTGEGDAFLNPQYLQMIKHLKRRNTSVYLVDSFDLIDNEVSHNLVASGVDGIYISMDGATKQTYESIKIGCDYDKVLSNIRHLLAWKQLMKTPLPELCFRFVVNKKNMREMADYVRVLRSLGSRSEFGDGSKIHFVGVLDFPEIHDMYVEEIPKEFITAAIGSSEFHKGSMPVVFAHTEEYTNPPIERCLAWMEPYFALVPHPMMLPCCAVLMSNSRARLKEYSFGDYTKESVKAMWDHPYYRWFRKTVTDPRAKVPALCAGCRAYNTRIRMDTKGVDTRTKKDFA